MPKSRRGNWKIQSRILGKRRTNLDTNRELPRAVTRHRICDEQIKTTARFKRCVSAHLTALSTLTALQYIKTQYLLVASSLRESCSRERTHRGEMNKNKKTKPKEDKKNKRNKPINTREDRAHRSRKDANMANITQYIYMPLFTQCITQYSRAMRRRHQRDTNVPVDASAVVPMPVEI